MQLFYKIVASGTEINLSTYSILLKNLLAAGNWRKYIEVIFIRFSLSKILILHILVWQRHGCFLSFTCFVNIMSKCQYGFQKAALQTCKEDFELLLHIVWFWLINFLVIRFWLKYTSEDHYKMCYIVPFQKKHVLP